MPSCPLPPIVVPESTSGWNGLEVTSVRSILIPVAAYRTAELVSWLAIPASRTRPPQSPGVVAGQTPDALGTKTEPQLGTGSVMALRLVSSAPVDVRVPFWTVIVPARIAA